MNTLASHRTNLLRNKSSYTNRCNNCSNLKCLLKRNIQSELVIEFSERKTEILCKKGQQFIIEGAPVNGLFLILKGTVKVFRTGINGKEQIVRFANAGDIIGHRGFGTQEHYTIGASALENTILCYFSKDLLQKVLKEEPILTYDLMLFYANELNRSEAKVKSLSQMTVRERVIDTLLYIHRKFGQHNDFLNLTLSRKEYADYAGTTQEQVIRMFSTLKKEQLISTKGKQVGILDLNLLKSEISEHNFYLDS